ncbi:MAG TPA: Gfo/Idh/MocA family oxidoreductase, partial [Tepidisphaeraceae bacterium]
MPITKIALIGCGQIARAVHLKLLPALKGAQLVAIAEPDPAARSQASAMAPAARAFADYRELLQTDVDAVIICLPNALHAPVAIEALRAGKHVYLEKPLATNLPDGAAVLDAWKSSHRVGAIGFNYRFNPLIQSLRNQLRQGGASGIGKLLAVRTIFSTAAAELPLWKRSRATGGGVLLDLASHHIDLIRYLLVPAEIESVSATISSTRHEADTAALEMRLSSGALIQSFFSWSSIEEDRIEIFGEAGKLVVDRYASLMPQFIPPRRRSRLAGVSQSLSTAAHLPYLLQKMRSPAGEPSFAIALQNFLRAIDGDPSDIATFADGYQSLAIIDAAERFAASGMPIALDTPRAAAAHFSPRGVLIESLPASAAPTHPSPAGQPRLSAILVTPDNYATIRRTVSHLRRQTAAADIELVIVAPRLDALNLIEEELTAFHSHQLVEHGPIRTVAIAFTAGIRAARAPIIALCEDHSFPEPQWAAALLQAHQQNVAAVGPVVFNANPVNSVSQADLLVGYGPWLEPHPAGRLSHLPGHNSSYKRDILLAYGDRLESMMEAETVMQWDLVARGHALYLEPAARLAHTNFAVLGVFLKVQYNVGRMFGESRRQGWPLWKKLFFAAASPL